MTEISAPGGVDRGETGERETDILDDEEDTYAILPALVAPSSACAGRLSSSDETRPALRGLVRTSASPSPRVLEQQRVLHAPFDYSRYIPEAGDGVVNGGGHGGHGGHQEPAPSGMSPPYTPPRGTSSREAVLRVALADTSSLSELSQEEELSLATDMEESIEQLNQLILDLDPTFVPVPPTAPRCPAPLRSTATVSGREDGATDQVRSGPAVIGHSVWDYKARNKRQR